MQQTGSKVSGSRLAMQDAKAFGDPLLKAASGWK
jgi:hypothetical protein